VVRRIISSFMFFFCLTILWSNTTETHKAANKPALELKKAAASAFAAFTIGASVLASPIVADAIETQPFTFTSTNIVSEKLVRQGLYQEYEVDVVQESDDARSTFKDAKETKTKKGTLRWSSFYPDTKF
jgi:hypothetical protein